MRLSTDPIRELKRRVADEILILLDGWTQANAGALLSERQCRVSELRAGRLERYSLERLLRFLARLNRGIEIVTRKRSYFTVLDHRRIPEHFQRMRPAAPVESTAQLRARMHASAQARARDPVHTPPHAPVHVPMHDPVHAPVHAPVHGRLPGHRAANPGAAEHTRSTPPVVRFTRDATDPWFRARPPSAS